MIVDWAQIKSLFQIPKSWFQYVHNYCTKSYGGNLINIKSGGDGVAEIYIDQDEFEQKVKEVAGEGYVKSVDGVLPNDNGEIDFGLTGSKWMKTTEDGHIGTTDDEPLPKKLQTGNAILKTKSDGTVEAINMTANRLLRTDSNGLPYTFLLDASKWVTTDANGLLTTTNDSPVVLGTSTGVLYSNAGALQYKAIGTASGNVAAGDHTHSQYLTSLPTSCLTTADINAPITSTRGVAGNYHSNVAYTGTLHGAVDNLYNWTGIYGDNDNVHSGNIDEYLEDDYVTVATDQTITGGKTFTSNVELTGGANLYVTGANNNNGIEVAYSAYKSQYLPGRIELYYTTPYIDFHLNSTAADFTSRIICNSNVLQLQDTRGITLNTTANSAILTNAPTAAATATDSKAIATVGWTASNFVPSTGYTASKWVKTDANGKLTTTNDTPVVIDTTKYTPQSGEITMVTSVVWTGALLQYKSKKLSFVNGVLCSVGNETTTTIDTPVAY